jgi:hypothetical protein
MFFSGYATDDTRRFIEQAGLAVTSLREERIVENGRSVSFWWVIANKPLP